MPSSGASQMSRLTPTFGPCCHMYLPRVLFRRQVHNVHLYQIVLQAYSTPVFRSASFLPALISHGLRAPCVTCERVPDLSGPVRRHVAPLASTFPCVGYQYRIFRSGAVAFVKIERFNRAGRSLPIEAMRNLSLLRD